MIREHSLTDTIALSVEIHVSVLRYITPRNTYRHELNYCGNMQNCKFPSNLIKNLLHMLDVRHLTTVNLYLLKRYTISGEK